MICNQCKHAGKVKAELEAELNYIQLHRVDELEAELNYIQLHRVDEAELNYIQLQYLNSLHDKCKSIRNNEYSHCTCQHRVDRRNV